MSLKFSLLQGEQPQWSQPAFIEDVLQPSDHLCELLHLLQQFHILVLGAPELDVLLQESKIEGENHLPHPADHISFDAVQDTVDLLGLKVHIAGLC